MALAARSLRKPLARGAAAVLLGGVAALTAAGGWFPAPAEPPTDAEKARLAALHRTAVEIFIARPGFGHRRMDLPVDDIVNAPKFDPTTRGSEQGRPAAAEKPADKSKPAHFTVEDLLTAKARRTPVGDKGGALEVRSVQLVGLVTHRDPVVYLAGKVPGRGKGAEKPMTREPDGFEAAALKALREGGGLQAERRGDELRALGPIYAGRRCAGCHEREGELLGAFSYRLTRTPAGASAPAGRGSE